MFWQQILYKQDCLIKLDEHCVTAEQWTVLLQQDKTGTKHQNEEKEAANTEIKQQDVFLQDEIVPK